MLYSLRLSKSGELPQLDSAISSTLSSSANLRSEEAVARTAHRTRGPLRERLERNNQDIWANERTLTPVRCFAVRLHLIGLSFREVKAVLDWLGVECCHQAVWYWKETLTETQSDSPTAESSRVTSTRNRPKSIVKRNGSTLRPTRSQNCCSMSTAATGLTPRRSRERDSRAAHQNATGSEDGVSPSSHREPRYHRDRVSRRC